MFSFASETFTFTAEGSCGRYAVTWYGLPAATRPVVQPVRSKSEPPAPSKMNRETCRIRCILEKLGGTLSTSVGGLVTRRLAGESFQKAPERARKRDKADQRLPDGNANVYTSRARAQDF